MSMKVFAKPFEGVLDGEIYPTQFKKGDECPSELEAAALSLGALEEGTASIDDMTIPQLKAALDVAKITYTANAKRDELVAQLKAVGAT